MPNTDPTTASDAATIVVSLHGDCYSYCGEAIAYSRLRVWRYRLATVCMHTRMTFRLMGAAISLDDGALDRERAYQDALMNSAS